MNFEKSLEDLKNGNSGTIGMLSNNFKEFHESIPPEELENPNSKMYRNREKKFIESYQILENAYLKLSEDFNNLKELLQYIHYSIHKKVGDNSCEFGDKCPFNAFIPGAPKKYPIQNVIQSASGPSTGGGGNSGGGQGNK